MDIVFVFYAYSLKTVRLLSATPQYIMSDRRNPHQVIRKRQHIQVVLIARIPVYIHAHDCLFNPLPRE